MVHDSRPEKITLRALPDGGRGRAASEDLATRRMRDMQTEIRW